MAPARQIIDYTPTVTYNYYETAMRLKTSLSENSLDEDHKVALQIRIHSLLAKAIETDKPDFRVYQFYQKAYLQGDNDLDIDPDKNEYERYVRMGSSKDHGQSVLALAILYADKKNENYSLKLANLYARKAAKLMPQSSAVTAFVKRLIDLDVQEAQDALSITSLNGVQQLKIRQRVAPGSKSPTK